MKPRALALLLLGLATSAVGVEQAPPKPLDFASGIPLELEPGHALYEVVLPSAVYRGVVRPDLGDVRVFNAADQVAVHTVRRPPASDSPPPAEVSLPIFPLYAEQDERPEQLAGRIERRADGAIVELKIGKKGKAERKLVGYLVDASVLQEPIQSLSLDWPTQESRLLMRLDVTRSDDLVHWSSATRGATVASLHYGAHALEQRRVELGNVKAKYLQIGWDSSQAPLQLSRVAAQLAGKIKPPEPQWTRLIGTRDEEEPGTYVFDLKGYLPVERVRVVSAERNTLLQVSLSSRVSADGEWQTRARGLAYDLQVEGEHLRSAPFEVGTAVRVRYWRLVVAHAEESVGTSAPQLEIGWFPDRLLFVARGEGPFLLAYGNASIGPPPMGAEGLLRGSAVDEQTMKIAMAQAGEPKVLGGDARLRPPEPPPPPLPWKQWALWAVLVLAVVVLGWLAWRLFQQLHITPGS
jgi:hypothetical protein